jgi:hypothetical protein
MLLDPEEIAGPVSDLLEEHGFDHIADYLKDAATRQGRLLDQKDRWGSLSTEEAVRRSFRLPQRRWDNLVIRQREMNELLERFDRENAARKSGWVRFKNKALAALGVPTPPA